MIFIVCHSGHALRVSPAPELADLLVASDWYPDKYPCPRCGSMMSLFENVDTQSIPQLDIVDVTPQEALAAFSGLGLPSEQDCSAAAVEKALNGATVARVVVRQIRNSHRSIVDFIELEGGTRVYLASSSLGATVYRIALKHSYAEEALRGEAG